ncbi:MAG: phosphoenolpyruvate synthase [Hyphomicrobium sp.]|uniref:phosphoenolpyruvate synthase n=1 Tax=Hyphomicrobium sp. TaxID=82 RepID=UPI0013217C83|nr:phosphoenolpyruvate synthase [Hyphomicrobium sp.]KAB2939573.1 MAG: phosphoenolpyruvate synthase [Hyphomicrobium sp.]MBZ0209273.1 phosphoenolpyruvate synthase [Hyphomicrobium sp.]
MQSEATKPSSPHILWFDDLKRSDVARVGGKNASLGEMVCNLGSKGVHVPTGFATTARAYWEFIDANNLREMIARRLSELAAGKTTLPETGTAVRNAILGAAWPPDLERAFTSAYAELCRRAEKADADVAVRSSATAEDLPEASFAGQQESFLNVRGDAQLLDACRSCYASLFTDRAISYRQAKGFDHMKVALSIGVQRMVRSDLGGAGVMFSIDTETGFDRIVLINAAWGLGENVVQGAVDPDEYQVFKPLLSTPGLIPIVEKKLGTKKQKMVYASESGRTTQNVPTSSTERGSFVLTDADILTLARWACAIEDHYGLPMDVEWAKDGQSGEIFIVQARPETVQSRKGTPAFLSYKIKSKGRRLVKGLSIGSAIVAGRVQRIESPRDIARFTDGSILVTATTDPDWVPIMKRAAAIVTDHGGRTSHAAIISRELGLPAVVGTGNATQILKDEQEITVSCAGGDEGFVYEGKADFETVTIDPKQIPATHTQIMFNLANPAAAFRWWRLPADGVGLLRMEFIVSNHVKVHPMALAQYDALEDDKAKQAINALTGCYADKRDYFIDCLSRGLARIAAAFFPKPVIVRMSDFKTNEYANLIGGAQFEPKEENPMLGFRGASRYYSPKYQEGFALECKAIRRLREEMGFVNVIVMIPFCRSTKEADRVLEVMAEHGLKRGDNGLQVYVMCEIPSNVILAKAFAERFDGFSIGSNDLTQLTLGVDRDSADLASLFDEQDEAVTWMIRTVIESAHESGAKVGLCGQAPSNHPEFAEFLVRCGIDSISITPDSFIAVKEHVAAAEARR